MGQSASSEETRPVEIKPEDVTFDVTTSDKDAIIRLFRDRLNIPEFQGTDMEIANGTSYGEIEKKYLRSGGVIWNYDASLRRDIIDKMRNPDADLIPLFAALVDGQMRERGMFRGDEPAIRAIRDFAKAIELLPTQEEFKKKRIAQDDLHGKSDEEVEAAINEAFQNLGIYVGVDFRRHTKTTITVSRDSGLDRGYKDMNSLLAENKRNRVTDILDATGSENPDHDIVLYADVVPERDGVVVRYTTGRELSNTYRALRELIASFGEFGVTKELDHLFKYIEFIVKARIDKLPETTSMEDRAKRQTMILIYVFDQKTYAGILSKPEELKKLYNGLQQVARWRVSLTLVGVGESADGDQFFADLDDGLLPYIKLDRARMRSMMGVANVAGDPYAYIIDKLKAHTKVISEIAGNLSSFLDVLQYVPYHSISPPYKGAFSPDDQFMLAKQSTFICANCVL